MDRRAFLKGAGVVTVLVVGGGVWRAYNQGVFSVGEGPAYEPWKNWRTDANDGPLALVRAAILAASPHNTQPWLFKVGASRIELYADNRRNTGALDPYLRELHIGLGCALENMMLAATANGYRASATLVPGKLEAIPSEPQPQLVAAVELEPGERQSSELYDAIPNRHTNRNPYNPQRPVPPEFVEALGRLASDETDVKILLIAAEAERRRIVEISSEANTEIYSDPDVLRGAVPWLRVNWSAVQKYRDGLAIDAAGLPPVATAIAKMMPVWLLRRLASHTPRDVYSNLMLSAPLIGIIVVHDRLDQQQNLRAGRIWQRAHLLATARGVAARPCNEAVEMIDHERALGKPARRAGLLGEVIGDAVWQPTFLFYMGYPVRKATPSARRTVKDVVV
jgi:hypothetical protein